IADDIFDSLADHPLNLIPKGAAILHARFDLLFADSPEPRSLDLRIPHTMQLENASDETIVRRWLCQRGFRIPLSQTISRNSIARALRKAFDLDSTTSDLGIPNTIQFASFSADAVPVILTIQIDIPSFRRAISELVASINAPFILFAPTSDQFDARSQSLLA